MPSEQCLGRDSLKALLIFLESRHNYASCSTAECVEGMLSLWVVIMGSRTAVHLFGNAISLLLPTISWPLQGCQV